MKQKKKPIWFIWCMNWEKTKKKHTHRAVWTYYTFKLNDTPDSCELKPHRMYDARTHNQYSRARIFGQSWKHKRKAPCSFFFSILRNHLFMFQYQVKMKQFQCEFKCRFLDLNASEISWQNIDTFNQWISIWICVCGVEWFVNDFTDIHAFFAWTETKGKYEIIIF